MTQLNSLNNTRAGQYTIRTADQQTWHIDLDARRAECGGRTGELIRILDARIGEPLRLALRDARTGIAATFRREHVVTAIIALTPESISA